MTDAEKKEFNELKHIVECLMIVHEGIQELDGTTTEVYNAANDRLKYKTQMLRRRKQMEKEKAEVEVKLRELQDTLKHYEECLG